MIDYFETPDLIPSDVRQHLDTWDDNADPIHECERILAFITELGWIFDYGLDGVPYELRPIGPPSTYKTDEEKDYLDNNETPLTH